MGNNLYILSTRSDSPSVKRSRRNYNDDDEDDDDDDSLSGGVGAPSPGSIRVTQVSTYGSHLLGKHSFFEGWTKIYENYLGERPCDSA